MAGNDGSPIRPLRWVDDGLEFIDTRFLPATVVHARADTVEAAVAAIEAAALGGPLCIDIFCAFGLVLARRSAGAQRDDDAALIARCSGGFRTPGGDAAERVAAAPLGTELDEATAILAERQRLERSIAEHAATLLPARGNLLTSGGSGALSTGGEGTAVGAIVAAHRAGQALQIYVAETQPQRTGRRLSAFELETAGVPCRVLPDSAAATVLRSTAIAAVIVGAVAIAQNGDAVAELGTYGIALAAARHRVPLYVAVPRAAIDRATAAGDDFAFAQGVNPGWKQRAQPSPADASRLAGLYDVTPGHLITAIVTEYGITRPPYDQSLATLATRPRFAFIDSSRRAER